MKLIICGSYKEYENYLKENNLNKNQAKFVYREEDLEGWINIEIVLYGNYKKNPLMNKSHPLIRVTE